MGKLLISGTKFLLKMNFTILTSENFDPFESELPQVCWLVGNMVMDLDTIMALELSGIHAAD